MTHSDSVSNLLLLSNWLAVSLNFRKRNSADQEEVFLKIRLFEITQGLRLVSVKHRMLGNDSNAPFQPLLEVTRHVY